MVAISRDSGVGIDDEAYPQLVFAMLHPCFAGSWRPTAARTVETKKRDAPPGMASSELGGDEIDRGILARPCYGKSCRRRPQLSMEVYGDGAASRSAGCCADAES